MPHWPSDWSYIGDKGGRCPWCGIGVRFMRVINRPRHDLAKLEIEKGDAVDPWDENGERDEPKFLTIECVQCPACQRIIISMLLASADNAVGRARLLYPAASARPPLPAEVPKHVADDYREAALVLPYSSKASAALARRCLQTVLREAAQTAEKDLAKQIDEVILTLPQHLADNIDIVRNIGNFAAHPQKSQHTGEIVDVEPHEAEWTLDVLDGLFEHYYVQPQRAQAKRDALNAKLAEVGKPPLKQPQGLGTAVDWQRRG